jgi:hypothetical protein
MRLVEVVAGRRRPALVTTLVLVLVAVSSAAAWSVVRGTGRVDGPLPEPMAAPRNVVATMAQEVYDSFSGTVRQRNAWGVVRAYVANHRMDDCMAAAGYPDWDWSRSRLHAGPEDALRTSVWFAEPDARFISQPLVVHKRELVAEAAMNSDDVSPARQAAVGTCASAARGPSPTPHPDAVRLTTRKPQMAWKLTARWDAALSGADEAAEDPATYYSCLDAAHLQILRRTDLPATELGEAVSTLAPANAHIPSSPTDPVARSEQWRALLREEKVITDADWACRKDVYHRHIVDLAPLVIAFASEHAREIATAQRQWRDLAVEAQALEAADRVG